MSSELKVHVPGACALHCVEKVEQKSLRIHDLSQLKDIIECIVHDTSKSFIQSEFTMSELSTYTHQLSKNSKHFIMVDKPAHVCFKTNLALEYKMCHVR